MFVPLGAVFIRSILKWIKCHCSQIYTGKITFSRRSKQKWNLSSWPSVAPRRRLRAAVQEIVKVLPTHCFITVCSLPSRHTGSPRLQCSARLLAALLSSCSHWSTICSPPPPSPIQMWMPEQSDTRTLTWTLWGWICESNLPLCILVNTFWRWACRVVSSSPCKATASQGKINRGVKMTTTLC